jgi:hypothetical protein
VRALYKGLAPALLRQVSYSSLSMVLYEPVRNAITTGGERAADAVPFYKRLLAGGVAGGVSIALVNPTEVLKTQQQTAAGRASMADIARRVYARDGVRGFWAGVHPNVCRTFLVQAAELGTKFSFCVCMSCRFALRLFWCCCFQGHCVSWGVLVVGFCLRCTRSARSPFLLLFCLRFRCFAVRCVLFFANLPRRGARNSFRVLSSRTCFGTLEDCVAGGVADQTHPGLLIPGRLFP